MPFDMAMEQPNAGIVAREAHDDVSVRANDEGITAHRGLGKGETTIRNGFWVPVSSVVVTTSNGLEGVAVEMERVFAGVVIVHHQLDGFVVVQDKGIGVDAIDCADGGVFA